MPKAAAIKIAASNIPANTTSYFGYFGRFSLMQQLPDDSLVGANSFLSWFEHTKLNQCHECGSSYQEDYQCCFPSGDNHLQSGRGSLEVRHVAAPNQTDSR
jgi:hypothetical protein